MWLLERIEKSYKSERGKSESYNLATASLNTAAADAEAEAYKYLAGLEKEAKVQATVADMVSTID